MREILLKELNYLNSNIDLNNFNSIKKNLKYFLRFELGDSIENGTIERINQSTTRATELFENFFDKDSELFILVYDFNFNKVSFSVSYLDEILNSESIKNEQYCDSLTLKSFTNQSKIEKVNKKLNIYFTKRTNINYLKIFTGIANYEMGFNPIIEQSVYFFEPKTKKWFWMYDDRGCLLYSQQISYLNPTLKKFGKWLVKSEKEEMFKQFNQ